MEPAPASPDPVRWERRRLGLGTASALVIGNMNYSSWSMRPWLALTHAGATFTTRTVELEYMRGLSEGKDSLAARRALGSVHGLFPVLQVDDTAIHESLAICEYAAEAFPDAALWPRDHAARALARAFSAEMHSGFTHVRSEMPCHLFARAPAIEPSAAAQREIARIFEIWGTCLERSGGPFLFGEFGIVDAMYFPVLTRLRTYGQAVPEDLAGWCTALDTLPAVRSLIEVAALEPRVPVYDAYIVSLGGDPDAALPPAG